MIANGSLHRSGRFKCECPGLKLCVFSANNSDCADVQSLTKKLYWEIWVEQEGGGSAVMKISAPSVFVFATGTGGFSFQMWICFMYASQMLLKIVRTVEGLLAKIAFVQSLLIVR